MFENLVQKKFKITVLQFTLNWSVLENIPISEFQWLGMKLLHQVSSNHRVKVSLCSRLLGLLLTLFNKFPTHGLSKYLNMKYLFLSIIALRGIKVFPKSYLKSCFFLILFICHKAFSIKQNVSQDISCVRQCTILSN